ncbi:MAG: hypothetical protein EBY52_09880 [Actinobacteria bacterium]|nr:hypothetical protein [Actinomycetota bacterium]
MGSALHVDEVLLIDVPQPWPKPVWAADGFTHVPEAVMAAGEQGRRVRALAAVPLEDGISRIVVHQRSEGSGPMIRSEFRMTPGEVGHDRRRVDQVGERSHRRPIAAEAVKDDDAHPLIASPTAVVMERRTAMS